MTNGWQTRILAAVESQLGGNWAELSRKTGLQPSTLQGVKRSKDCQVSTLLRICEALHLDVNLVLTGQPPPPEREADESGKERLKQWLDEFWEQSDVKRRNWLEVQFEMAFPPYQDWLKRQK